MMVGSTWLIMHTGNNDTNVGDLGDLHKYASNMTIIDRYPIQIA